nr:FBD-associated F-box protein At5g18780-like [Aegilops tauschii subsp. strangulata]
MADSKKVAVAGGKDRFEDLPEHVLELLLSFLDARDVVRTSVLARRWRDLWKSVPVLRFRPSSKFGCAENFNNFVNKVLECRKFPPVRVSAPSAIANLDPGSVRNLQTVSCFLLDPVTDPFATLMPLVVPDPVIVAAILATAHASEPVAPELLSSCPVLSLEIFSCGLVYRQQSTARLTLKKTLSSTTLLALLNQSKFIGCAKILVTSHSTAPKSKLKAVY